MAIELIPVDRSNWRSVISLKVRPEQETYVATAAKSLAMCFVRVWGEEYDYRPFAICDGASVVVGYVTLVSNPSSADDYWIDDIMIDAGHQGQGYGRAALDLVLRFIVREYPRCKTVRLTCFRGNTNAAALYESVGFVKTGNLTAEFGEPEYALSGKPLAKYKK